MSKELSILKTQSPTDDTGNAREVAGAFLKGLISYAPHMGPMLAETTGVIIPVRKLNACTSSQKYSMIGSDT